MSVKTLNTYNNWEPVLNPVIKDKNLAKTIHEKGYAVMPFLNASQLQEILEFYNKEHQLKVKNGGMFYSLYSKDLAYRKRIHETLGELFKPLLDERFVDYKNIINTFITKISGPESEFYTHQDTTALDEFKHSPLSIWIPLQDMTPENGALSVIEKTHWFFSPYRGVSFPFPFVKINETLRQYLKPLYVKAGEAIIFDSRLIHNSMPNLSGTDRLVALCGVFPKHADFVTCYKSKDAGSKIEVFKHDDKYILEHEGFYYDCHARPTTGEKIGEIEEDFPEMDAGTFEKLCELNAITKTNLLGEFNNIPCQMIAEPDGINLTHRPKAEKPKADTVWQKLKAAFH